jgi:catechol 2,3-dioxygenase-like lactoylglutathione lyase family enzyme
LSSALFVPACDIDTRPRAGVHSQSSGENLMSIERPTHAGLRHLALNVRDLESMKRFYVELLGFAIEWEPDSDNIYLSSGVDNLALHRSPAATLAGTAAPSAAPGALDHLGLVVRTPESVDDWAAFLASRGVTIDAMPRTHRDGARSCYFRDPDGNQIQVIHHPPISDKV